MNTVITKRTGPRGNVGAASEAPATLIVAQLAPNLVRIAATSAPEAWLSAFGDVEHWPAGIVIDVRARIFIAAKLGRVPGAITGREVKNAAFEVLHLSGVRYLGHDWWHCPAVMAIAAIEQAHAVVERRTARIRFKGLAAECDAALPALEPQRLPSATRPAPAISWAQLKRAMQVEAGRAGRVKRLAREAAGHAEALSHARISAE